jgi:catechol 2,3-dioxygenase-like lactoylglutathione lyase family enzyme
MTTDAVTQGAHHIGLTVPNLSKTRSFFMESLGFDQVGEIAHYPAAFLSDGTTMITLWQAADPATAIPFDRKNVIGLHHFAVRVRSSAVLDDLYRSLSETAGVAIEFAPESLGGGATKHMMIAIARHCGVKA